MMVSRLKVRPAEEIAELSARPVMMPGNAIGRTSTKDRASRPKNLNRCTAKAANDPRTSAITVAPTAAFSDVRTACRTSTFRQATPNQCVVRLEGGHFCPTAELNAYRKITAIGTYRNAKTTTDVTRRKIRTARVSTAVATAPPPTA